MIDYETQQQLRVQINSSNYVSKTRDRINNFLINKTPMKHFKIKNQVNKAFLVVLLLITAYPGIYALGENRTSENKLNNSQQGITVTGTIVDSKGEPLAGVNVVIEGTTTGVITDINGKFSIQVPGEKTVLVVSYIGFLTEKVEVGTQRDFKVTLAEDIRQLNEVVVTAFGLKREEKSLGYAVSSINAKDITLAGPTNFASALAGRAAGVKVNTANGGASSAVNIQIRGVSSISGNTQPLYIVNGVPIRNTPLLNTKSNGNNSTYDDEQRVRENGILDINPEDVESLTILKGASASALYGSDAANGVVIITTKKGSAMKKGLGVDFNYQYDVEKLAFQPDFQYDYGRGYDHIYGAVKGADYNGWVTESDGSVHPLYKSAYQFGPKFDGREIKYWDGSTQKYQAYKNNYKDFFQSGYNSTANVGFSNSSENSSYRFSYSRNDYKSIMPGSKMNKNYFNFNGTFKLNKDVSFDLSSSFINSYVHNRPYMMNQLFCSYGGFLSPMDNMDTFYDKYKTTKGYKYVTYDKSYDTDERLPYEFKALNILDYLWTQLKNSNDEYQDRFINNITLNFNITPKLNLRGKLGNDFTSLRLEKKEYAEYSSAFGKSGSYTEKFSKSSMVYGDALIIFKDNITDDLNYSLTGGYTGKIEKINETSSATSGGLVIENWFSMVNSSSTISTETNKENEASMAGFGILDLSYKQWLNFQGTGRYEKTSTLLSKNNSYFYPSFNGSFVFSDVLKLPEFFNYGKIRAAWGMVGNHPSRYKASVSNSPGSLKAASTASYMYPNSSSYGNDNLKSEKKIETELGLETNFLNNKLGVNISYYHSKTARQILEVSTAASSGASTYWTNAGDLSNNGIEITIKGTPLKINKFRWDASFNYSYNKNKLTSLAEGFTQLEFKNIDNGALRIYANVGDALGNVYVHPYLADANGNRIIDNNGWYTLDLNNYKKVGNIMPKAVGGFSNTFSYKNLTLNILMDYRLGGDLVSRGMLYMTGAGMFKSTLKYRDAANGGSSYDIDANRNLVANSSGTYHDGLILKGVTSSGAENTKMIDAASYYENHFGWGVGASSPNDYSAAVHENSFIKLREVSLSYNLPKIWVSKIGFQGLQVSVTGRNLCYLWRTLPNNWDPESAIGSSWLYQGLDEGAAAPTRSMGVALRASF
jgi:iron complex outermembrane recepter protein